MTDNLRIDVPFQQRPPRLKDLINIHVMGDVWVFHSAQIWAE